MYLYIVTTRTTKYMYTQHHSYLYQNLATPLQAYWKSTALILQGKIVSENFEKPNIMIMVSYKNRCIKFSD